MKTLMLCFGLAVAFVAVPRCGAVLITWDGGGGDFSWQNASNWSGNVLPGQLDDVVINVAGNPTIASSANVTIRSLQCSNHLALSGGIFKVTDGASTVQGNLSSSGNPTLSASGPTTVWTVAGSVSVNGLNLDVSGGATISLPTLASYDKGPGCFTVFWKATGSGSLLDLFSLTNLTGAVCASLNVQALSGGEISIPNLATVTEGTAAFLADGTNSLVDVSGLPGSPAASRTVSFEARDGGTLLMPQMSGGPKVTVAIKSGGVLPVTQLRELSGFTVSGTNADFGALTNLTTGNVAVEAGAVVTASNLVSHIAGAGCFTPIWLVSGSNSLLNLSSLTELGGPACASLRLQAKDGGTLILSNLPSVIEGTLEFLADGTNSLVDLGGLQQSLATSRLVTFEARNSGRMWIPQLPGGPTVAVTLKSHGVLPVTQLGQLAGLTVDAMSVDFPGLTNLVTGGVTVGGGAVVTLPGLGSYAKGTTCVGVIWQASGAGSVLDLSALTSLSGGPCATLSIQALSGGAVIASNLPSITDGTVNFLADGTNSRVDLGGLQQSLATSRAVTFEARNSGTMWMPQFPGAPTATVTLKSNGVLPVTQLGQLAGLTVDAMHVDFPGVTNLGTSDVKVGGGGVVTLSGLVDYAKGTPCAAVVWQASGTGSVLDLSALTNLSGGPCAGFNIQAMSGGEVIANNLQSIAEGTLSFLADGTNSLINLSSLTDVLATDRTVSFEARNSGTIAIPLMEGGSTVTVAIKSSGLLDATQLRLLKGLTVSGTSLDLPGITNLFAGDLTVDQGAVLALPNLFAHDQGSDCAVNTWLVSGAGSVLDLSSVTNLTGAGCGSLTMRAAAGGTMILSNLPGITEGTVLFVSDGAGSQVDLTSLQESLATLHTVSFTVSDQGSIHSPWFLGGPTVNLIVHSNGVMPIAQMTRLSGITANAVALDFPALTNFDGGTCIVTNGAVVTASNLAAWLQPNSCAVDSWIVKDAGSVLNLPALAQLTGDSCGPLEVQALSGGQLRLGSLTHILEGKVNVRADGTGSLVDLHSLVNFLNSAGLSSLVATNGGTVLLNDAPFLLSGVNVDFAAGTPHLPATLLGGTNLVLHGLPWHSYWVEIRDTTAATNAWQFAQRVPLTNEFQVIATRAPANREFRVWEFVADPYWLELSLQTDANIRLVLYGPANQTFEVLATTNLTPVINWQTLDTITLTNTFRIFAPEPMTAPERYFRVNPL